MNNMIPQSTLLKCIELRKQFDRMTKGEAKRAIESLPIELKIALMIGYNITSIKELTNK